MLRTLSIKFMYRRRYLVFKITTVSYLEIPNKLRITCLVRQMVGVMSGRSVSDSSCVCHELEGASHCKGLQHLPTF